MKIPAGERSEVRIVGTAPEEIKEQQKRKFLSSSGGGHYAEMPNYFRQEIEKYELSKTETEKYFIEAINEITNELRLRAGVEEFDLPAENVHIFPAERYNLTRLKKPKNGEASAFYLEQAAVLSDALRKDPVMMAAAMFHEIGGHLKGYLAFEAYEGYKEGESSTKVDEQGNFITSEKYESKLYRAGLQSERTLKNIEKEGPGPHGWFVGLNEAIVAELVKRYLPQMLNMVVAKHPECEDLKKEIEWEHSEEAGEIRHKAAESEGDEEGDVWVFLDKSYGISGYLMPRKVLSAVTDLIFTDNKDRFASKDEVVDLFFMAHYNGRMVELGRLVEKSFGTGAFRVLGGMGRGDNESITKTVELLRAGRKKITRK